MNLSHHVLREQDCAECYSILEKDAFVSDAIWAQLPRLWADLSRQGAIVSTVTVDMHRPPGKQVVHFGASVFIACDLYNQLIASPPKSLTELVFGEHLSGNRVILTRPEIGSANARGELNVAVLHSALNLAGMSEVEMGSLMALGPESFLRVHGGYNIKNVVIEPPEEQSRQFMVSSGFVERSIPCNAAQRPCLVGLNRREAKANSGAYAARIFVFKPPRIFFSQREQELLICALDDFTDDESARILSVALPTIKTRWKQIYCRVASVDPTLLPESEIAASPGSERRGSEKRRHLIAYLRLHLEELRPYDARHAVKLD